MERQRHKLGGAGRRRGPIFPGEIGVAALHWLDTVVKEVVDFVRKLLVCPMEEEAPVEGKTGHHFVILALREVRWDTSRQDTSVKLAEGVAKTPLLGVRKEGFPVNEQHDMGDAFDNVGERESNVANVKGREIVEENVGGVAGH